MNRGIQLLGGPEDGKVVYSQAEYLVVPVSNTTITVDSYTGAVTNPLSDQPLTYTNHHYVLRKKYNPHSGLIEKVYVYEGLKVEKL